MMTYSHTNPDGTAVTATLGKGVKLGNDITLGDDITLGNYVRLGKGVKLGNGVAIDSPSDVLCGLACDYWSLHCGLLQYGCETHPIGAWDVDALCEKHARTDCAPAIRRLLAVGMVFFAEGARA